MSKFNEGDKVHIGALKDYGIEEGTYVVTNPVPDDDGDIRVVVEGTNGWLYAPESECYLVATEEMTLTESVGTPKEILKAADKVLSVNTESSTVGAYGDAGPNPYELNTNQEGKSEMSNVTRSIVKVVLIDEDAGLDVAKSLVHDFGEHVVEGTVADLKMQLAADNDIAAILAKHNAERAKELNLDILNHTGSKVKLLPRKLSELTWKTSQVA